MFILHVLFLCIVILTSSLQATEMNPVILAAVSIGAKNVEKSTINIEDDVNPTDGMKSYVLKIEWPKDVKYRWKDKSSDIGLTLYSLDFSGPIEIVGKDDYENNKLAGCVVLATTEHGQLVIPKQQLNEPDPVVWFLDSDDEEEYLKWQKRKMKLSEVIIGLIIQGKSDFSK